jgi:guanylate kinase
MEINPPSDEAIMNRLIDAQEDKYNVIKNRFNEWEKNVPKLEEAFKMILSVQQSDKAID